MRGWLASIVEWFRGGEPEGSAQMIVEELVEQMTVQEWQEQALQSINNLVPSGTSPRLRAYLESQSGTAMITPWAIFRD